MQNFPFYVTVLFSSPIPHSALNALGYHVAGPSLAPVRKKGLSIFCFGSSSRFYFLSSHLPWKCLYLFAFLYPPEHHHQSLLWLSSQPSTKNFSLEVILAQHPNYTDQSNTCSGKLMLKALWRELLIPFGPKIRKSAQRNLWRSQAWKDED